MTSNEDVVANLPPALRRRIRLRRFLRYGGLIGTIVVVAAVVGLVMRTNPPQPARETFTKPPNVAFFGSLVGPQFPLEATVLIQGGYDQDGMLDIFKSPVSFSLFDVGGGAPKLLYRSPPGQFNGAFEKAPTFAIKLPGVPLRVVACVAYTAPKTLAKTALLVGYTFLHGGSPSPPPPSRPARPGRATARAARR